VVVLRRQPTGTGDVSFNATLPALANVLAPATATAYGSHTDMKAALAWDRVLAGLPPEAAGEWGDALEAWLCDLETELERP
jgi:hypothetical protein